MGLKLILKKESDFLKVVGQELEQGRMDGEGNPGKWENMTK